MSSLKQQAIARFEAESPSNHLIREKWLMRYQADLQFADYMIKLIKGEKL